MKNEIAELSKYLYNKQGDFFQGLSDKIEIRNVKRTKFYEMKEEFENYQKLENADEIEIIKKRQAVAIAEQEYFDAKIDVYIAKTKYYTIDDILKDLLLRIN